MHVRRPQPKAPGPSTMLLSSEPLSDALSAIQQVTDERALATALNLLAPYLSAKQLGESLAVAQNLENDGVRARCLLALAPYVLGEYFSGPPPLVDTPSLVKALRILAPHLPKGKFKEILSRLKLLEEWYILSFAFSDLAPHLSEQQLSEALTAARAIEHEDARARALGALARHLSEQQLSEALTAARAIEDEDARARALGALARHLSEQQLSEALTAARAIEHEDARARALGALARHLSEQQPSEALTAARAIEDEDARARTLGALARHLSEVKHNRRSRIILGDAAHSAKKPTLENDAKQNDITIRNALPRFRFQPGVLLLRIPRLMWLEVSERVHLRVAPKASLSVEDRAAIERTMTGRGETAEYPLAKLGLSLKAVLHADDTLLSVKALSSEAQDTDLVSPLVWDWNVLPTQTGQTSVTLRVTILADAAGQEMTTDLDAIDETIRIRVKSWTTKPRRFWRQNWKWLLGPSGIGLIGAAYAIWKVLKGI